jgi:cellulose synthase/poly-beta-1,6-N-acetylglucosamine synthase-like glycosyltransferase
MTNISVVIPVLNEEKLIAELVNRVTKNVEVIESEYEVIIIDDGSHHMDDQQISLYYLTKVLKSGGIYVLEDIHTSLGQNNTPLYGKTLQIMPNRVNTTLSYLKNKPLESLYLTDAENQK